MARKNNSSGGGVPANTNPFCVVEDVCIDDGILELCAPLYFIPGRGTNAPSKVESPEYSQEVIEEMVREMYETDILDGSFAVRKSFVHIIPEELRGKVLIAPKWDSQGKCNSLDCYRLTK